MTQIGKSSDQDRGDALRLKILNHALQHVAFDGWSDRCLAQAALAAGYDSVMAKVAFPGGGVDAAIAFHRLKDQELAEKVSQTDLSVMKVRERVTYAVRLRLELVAREKEAVRRAAALLALPIHAPDSARLIWETADTIWTALGDPSEDLNWYTKRAILSVVYSSTVLFWLGDDSPCHAQTWAFLSRRIEGVMRFEKTKATINASPLGKLAMAVPNWLASKVRKPSEKQVDTGTPVDLPG
jgi:ubiquinone biosynthesis protein COQ9